MILGPTTCSGCSSGWSSGRSASRTATATTRPRRDGHAHAAIRPVGWHEIAGLTPLMVLIVLIGIYPGPFLDRIRPAGRADRRRTSRAQRGPAERRPIAAGPDVAAAAPAVERPLASSARSTLDHAQPGQPSMTPSIAYEIVQQTLADPAAGVPPPAVGDRDDDGRRRSSACRAGPGARSPRRPWSRRSSALLARPGTARPTSTRRSPSTTPSSFYGRLVLLLTGLILLALAHDQVDDARAAEFFGALLMINAGAMLVAAANELVFLFVGLELVSIPTYLLLYLPRRTPTTQEAATKYFFLSIFSSGLLLFGLAYLYGLTGVSNLKALAYLVAARPAGRPAAAARR